MDTTCLKCGHVHLAGGAPPLACPNCGAVYAKVQQAMAAKASLVAAVPPAPPLSGQDAVVLTRPVAVLLAVVLSLGAYAIYDNERRKGAKVAAESQRVEERRARDVAERQEAAARWEEESRQRREKEAAKRAAMTPADLRREQIAQQFSGWDGSHTATEQAIRARMNNPDSYQHVVTTYVDHGPGRGMRVTTKFRGTNGFNAVVVNFAVAEVDESGAVTALRLAD
jgi:predicted  nucleic acid-binding Zn-ribbon protein